MSVSITVDTSQVREYVVKLEGVKGRLLPVLGPTFKRAAQNIKTATQADLRGSGNAGFRSIAAAVQYDEPKVSGSTLQTEIGIDKGSPGSLGNIAVFGTYKGGGTRQHPEVHAESELPVFEGYVLSAVEALL